MPKTLYLQASQSGQIELAAEMLLSGKLVAFPTETVYGLGGLACNESSLKGIFEAKNRPSNNPLILHVSAQDAAFSLFDFKGSAFETLFLKRFELLSSRFWPGPLTMVGRKGDSVSDTVTAGSPKVAVRLPSHPVARHLLQLVGKSIAAPSANLFTRPSPTSCQHVLRNLDTRVDAVIDGGNTEFGIESTVIDIDGERPKVLRHGAISFNDLAKVFPDLLANPIGSLKEAQSASPGLSEKHYAPHISQVQLANELELAKAWFSSSGIILREATESLLSKQLGKRSLNAGPLRVLPNDAQGCARELFVAFYEMETHAPQSLLIENLLPLAPSEDWAALCDRLLRASARS